MEKSPFFLPKVRMVRFFTRSKLKCVCAYSIMSYLLAASLSITSGY